MPVAKLLGQWPGPIPKLGPNADWQYDLYNAGSGGGYALSELEETLTAARSNSLLSDTGKAEAIRIALAVGKRYIAEMLPRVRDGHKRYLDLRSELTRSTKRGGDALLEHARAAEIRTWLLSMDIDTRRATLRDALNTRDLSVLSAAFDAPKLMALIGDAETRERIEIALTENRDPKAFAEMQEAKDFTIASQQSLAAALERMHNLAKLPPPQNEIQLSTAANVLSDMDAARANLEAVIEASRGWKNGNGNG
jgi:hypothetical protein